MKPCEGSLVFLYVVYVYYYIFILFVCVCVRAENGSERCGGSGVGRADYRFRNLPGHFNAQLGLGTLKL